MVVATKTETNKESKEKNRFFRNKFVSGMIRIALQLWKTRSMFNTKEVKDVVFLHYDPRLAPEPAIVRIREQFLKSYTELSGKDPIVVALPYGYQISSLNVDEFLSVLTHDQVNAMQHALYRKRNKIEVVN